MFKREREQSGSSHNRKRKVEKKKGKVKAAAYEIYAMEGETSHKLKWDYFLFSCIRMATVTTLARRLPL